MLPKLSLVLGGANSGKSAYAEKLCIESGLDRIYLATAQAFDAEMAAKISAHKKARGPGWTTVEAPLEAAGVFASRAPNDVILMDCATLWLSNHLLAERDLDEACRGLLAAISGSAARVVVVSNEVGLGVVPDTSLGRRFRSAQGRLNQDLAAIAERVVLITAGLPLALKGSP